MSKTSTSDAMSTFRKDLSLGRIRNKFDNSNLGIVIEIISRINMFNDSKILISCKIQTRYWYWS